MTPAQVPQIPATAALPAQSGQPVQVAAVANAIVGPDPLAPSLSAVVSQLDSKVREYFGKGGAEQGETLRNDTKSKRAYLLDQKLPLARSVPREY